MELNSAQETFKNDVHDLQKITVTLDKDSDDDTLSGKVQNYQEHGNDPNSGVISRFASLAVGKMPRHWTIYDFTNHEGLRIKFETADEVTGKVEVEEDYEITNIEIDERY